MEELSPSFRLLEQEAQALLARLESVRPFSLQMAAVPAACVSPAAQTAIDTHLGRVRRELHDLGRAFLSWLRSPRAERESPARAQRRFTILRLRFNALLSQLDIFADVLVQRGEHESGVWVSGLDALAADALAMPGYYQPPPVVCYLDRGHGAAIRRARTRLPGGDENPVAIIRVPRERMVGSGIASSLIHEVGHQAAALLHLIESLTVELREAAARHPGLVQAWQLFERWISEIVADFWSMARVGVGATLGLIGVVSLPRAFVFRINLDDPHPFPWIRVKLSCALGRALYPHRQWNRLETIWESFYPVAGLETEKARLVALLEDALPAFVHLLANHRSGPLRGHTLAEAVADPRRHPVRLTAEYEAWGASPQRMRRVAPTMAFAVIGQARANEALDPLTETRWIGALLTHWALHATLDTTALCAEVTPLLARARPSSLPTPVNV